MERIEYDNAMESHALQREFRSLKETQERWDLFAAAALTGLIAALNTLFDMGIPLNFGTWFAVVFLLTVTSGKLKSGN